MGGARTMPTKPTASEIRRIAGRVLAERKNSSTARDKEAAYRSVSAGKVRRVQEAFKRARKGEGLFGLKNAK
jgi:hypothetical protein